VPSEWDLRWLVFTDDGIQTSNLRKVPRTIAEMRALEESLLAMNNQYTQQNQTEPRNVADSKKVKQKSAEQVRKQQTSSAKALRKLETTAKKEGWISLDSKIKHKESMRIYNLPENVEKRRLGRIENEKRFIEQRKLELEKLRKFEADMKVQRQQAVQKKKIEYKYKCSYCNSGTDLVCDVANVCKNGICKKCRESGKAAINYDKVVVKKGWIVNRVAFYPDGHQCKRCSTTTNKWFDDGSDVGDSGSGLGDTMDD